MVNAELHRFVDKNVVRAAILRAEQATDAAIAVSIAPPLEGDVRTAALRVLHARTGLRSRARGSVLFFVVPSRREFAVVGNASAHERLGQAAWDEIVALVSEHFRRGDPTGGLVAGIDAIGGHLARHFPRNGGPPA